MKGIYPLLIILLLSPLSTSAVEEPAYTEVGFKIGDVFEFVVMDGDFIFSKYSVLAGETFNMTVKTLPEEGFRVSQIEIQYKNNTYLQPMSTNMPSEYFIYNNWTYWTETMTYNRTYYNTTYIGSVSSNDTSFTFNWMYESETQIVEWYAVYDLNGVIISEKGTENGVGTRHFERVFPVESDTEVTPTSFIITSNPEATIIDPLPFSLSYLLFLFLPILSKIKNRLKKT